MKKPLVGICIFLCLGIWLAKYIPIPQYILFISAFILPILTFIMLRHNRRISTAFLWLCFFVLGAFLLKNAEMLPSNHINRYISNKGKAAYLKGIVDNDPVEKRLRYGNRTTCILNAYKLGINNREYDVCGKVLVNIYRSENLEYGNEVLLKGKIYKPMRFQISDRLNYRDYLKQKNIYGIFSVKKDIPVTILGQRIENPLKTFAFKLKRKVKNIFVGHLPFLEAAFMKAMFLGERQDIPQFLKDVFARTGTVHILAISGLHVGIIIFIILFFLKAVRIPRKTRFVITMMFLIVYVFITGARPSVIRAAVMAMVLLGGYLFEREIDVYNSLAAAALMILLYNPKQLFDIGFQLSFLSVISIIYLYPRFEKKMIKREFPGIVKFFMKCFCVSSAAWLGVAGLIAYYFNIITLISVFANLIIVPFISVIIALGLSFVFCGVLLPKIIFIFAFPLKLSLFILAKTAYAFSLMPFAYFYTGSFNIRYVILYYSLIVFIFGFGRVLLLTKSFKYDRLA